MPIYDGMGFDGGCDEDQEEELAREDWGLNDPDRQPETEDGFLQDRDPDDERDQ